MVPQQKKWLFGLTTGCLVLALLPCGCGLFIFFPRFTQKPPHIVNVRKDAQGNVIQSIVLDQAFWTVGALPGPHGFTPNRYYSTKYFLEEPGKARRELPFIHDYPIYYPHSCLPIEDTSLWVLVGFFDMGMHAPITVVLFDETHVIRVHRIERKSGEPPKEFGISQWKFENGNRKLVYVGSHGLEAYDVITDTTAPWVRAAQ